MRVLLVNDDGIHAPGLAAMAEALAARFEVVVIAPHMERSASGQAITMRDPLMLSEAVLPCGCEAYSLTGTPADCAKFGVWHLQKIGRPADLCVSGINEGANIGCDAFYSGTVSAAREASFQKVPSMAVSIGVHGGSGLRDFRTAAEYGAAVAEAFLRNPLQKGVVLNLNLPDIPKEQIKGTVVRPMAAFGYRERYEKHISPRGHAFYWLGFDVAPEDEPGTDANALSEGYAVLTPLHWDLTHRESMKAVAAFMPPLR